MVMNSRTVGAAAALLTVLTLAICAGAASAQDAATVQISLKDHRFVPGEISAPAHRPIILRVKNLDPTPSEFESVSLRVEKIVAGNSEGIINLRPLDPGRYQFFDDFNKATTQGVLVVQ